MKCDEGYSYMSISRCGQKKHSRVQISRLICKDINDIMTLENDNELISKNDVEEELSNMKDWIFSTISRMIEMKQFKHDFLTDKQLDELK